MKIKNLIITIISITIIGCGSSCDSAVSTATTPVKPVEDKIIFQDNFDNQEDWTSDEFIKNNKLPKNWFHVRSKPRWSPHTGHNDKHATAEVLAKNSDKAYGGKGKSYVMWREGTSSISWNSDAILFYYLGQDKDGIYDFNKTYDKYSGLNEIYVEFYITFSDKMINTYYKRGVGLSKIFRILHYDGEPGKLTSYFEGKQNPNFIWNGTGGTTYGFRNSLAFFTRRVDNNQAPMLNPPHTVHKNGISASYFTHSRGMEKDGSDPIIINQLTGKPLNSLDSPYDLDEVFGDEKKWIKVAFYLKLNSAPGKFDGKMIQWLDGQRIMNLHEIAWIQEGRDMVKWNIVAIGGNDYLDDGGEARYEDWYAIDNVVIRSTMPAHLQ